MALAAAHFETGQDTAERKALEWLESLPISAPQIVAAEHMERPVVTHYVPVNDKAGPSKAPLQSASGLMRTRQPRTFARAWLEDDTVFLIWPEADADGHFAPLENLCGKVSRIGHSASLVQMWASQAAPGSPANWLPDEDRATEQFRIASAGSLQYLEQQFNQTEIDEFFELKHALVDGSDKKRKGEIKTALEKRFQNQTPIRRRPQMSLSHGYARAKSETQPHVAGTIFDPRLLIFGLNRVNGPYRHLDLSATLQLTARFRESLLQHFGTHVSETLSGHKGEMRAERAHLAFLPLPFVGHQHSHGGVLGIAVAIPRAIELYDKQRLLQALTGIRREGLKLGALGCCEVCLPDLGDSPLTLQSRSWTASPTGARQWATVTPYVYDRHSKAKDRVAYQNELADALRLSWERVGQEQDLLTDVIVTPVSPHLGAPASHEFPRLTRKDGNECRHSHVILIFDRPVVGPILLGAGRFRGYGLFKPVGA
jgi:CRISPR-associated protein Csb2